MKLNARVLRVLAFTLVLILSACGHTANDYTYQIQEEVVVDKVDSVVMVISAGRVIVLNGKDTSIEIVGSITNPDALIIEEEEGFLGITSKSGGASDSLTIYLPGGFPFELSTFGASVEIQGSFGKVDVKSTAGDVWLHDFEADSTIWAGRGAVHVGEGRGEIKIFSEHGDQSVESFTGIISMTSIMGNLNYFGIDEDENKIALEVDHGSVKVALPASVGQQVRIASTSGIVNCVGTGLTQTLVGCEGVLGSGVGILKVRTVSGNVDLWVSD